MSKTITYSGLVVSAVLMVVLFVTAKSYTQLAIAVILYPLLAYFALRILPRMRKYKGHVRAVVTTTRTPESPKVEVADIDKRTFLKLIGTAGLTFFIFSILGRRAEYALYNKGILPSMSGVTPPTDPSSGGSLTSAQGYKITEVDDTGSTAYYGFVNSSGSWFIMKQDQNATSFRYAGGNSNFTQGWKDRKNLKYDYYYNLFR